jgi:chitodextrinase
VLAGALHFRGGNATLRGERRLALPIEPAKNLLSALLFFGLVLVAAGARAAEVTLAWDANRESDLEGYGVYYKAGTEGPPYGFFGYVALSDLADQDSPTFAVSGLQPDTRYHFAITAYDSAGNESALSASVCAEVGAVVTPCAVSDGSTGATPPPPANPGSSSTATASIASGGGGGGGGCFIQTLALF